MSVCRGTIQAGQLRPNNCVVQRTNNRRPEPPNMRLWATLLFVAILLKHTLLLAFGAMVKVVVEALDAARENGVEHRGTGSWSAFSLYLANGLRKYRCTGAADERRKGAVTAIPSGKMAHPYHASARDRVRSYPLRQSPLRVRGDLATDGFARVVLLPARRRLLERVSTELAS